MLWSFFIALSLLEEEGRLACKMCSSSPIIFKFRFREPHWTQNNCRIEDWIKKNWRSVVVRCKTVTYLVCAVFLFIGLFVLSHVCVHVCFYTGEGRRLWKWGRVSERWADLLWRSQHPRHAWEVCAMSLVQTCHSDACRWRCLFAIGVCEIFRKTAKQGWEKKYRVKDTAGGHWPKMSVTLDERE